MAESEEELKSLFMKVEEESEKVGLKLNILQARLQQYVNHELSDVQAGFRKGRGTRVASYGLAKKVVSSDRI